MIALYILVSLGVIVAYAVIGAYAMGWMKPYAELMCKAAKHRRSFLGSDVCNHRDILAWTAWLWWAMVPAVIARLVASDEWQRFRRLVREERAEARMRDARQARVRTEQLIAELDASRAEAQASLRRIQDVAA